MSRRMELSEAFAAPLGGAPWEKEENPCAYTLGNYANKHTDAARHQLGLVGGNEVSTIRGSAVDLESDLRGITRINTFAPWRQYQPTPQGGVIHVKNWKTDVKIDTAPVHLKETQMWGYPAVYSPSPMVRANCMEPHKF
jgi:hypothetical protein